MADDWKAEVLAELALIRARVESTRWVALLACVSAMRSGLVDADELIRLVEAETVSLTARGNPNTAGALLTDIEHLKGLYQDGSMDPLKTIFYMTALHLDAGPEHREALQEWLLTGTPEELADDLRAAVERLVQPRRD